MRAVIIGAGMGGLMTALALRQSGVFASIDIYEQTKVPSTAGAGLNIPPNGARICRWLGVDLDGGDPKGPDGVIDGGRAAILESTRQFNADGSVTKRPFDHVTAAGDGAGFHHMHRLDLMMCLYKRVFEFGPDSGAPCPITVHMDCRLTQLRQTAGEVTATFSNGRTATGEVLLGADGINSATLQLAWPNPRPKRWTEVTCFRGLIPRTVVASLRKADGSPLDHNPINSFSMDRHRNDRSGATTYWVRGGELLNVWIARYEPNSAAFEQEEGDWFPVGREILREVGEAFTGSASRDDLLALAGAIVRPTKWGLYDRDALETWVQGRICLLGDAAHPMLPTFGQGAAQSFRTPPRSLVPSTCTAAMWLQRCCTTNACGITAPPASNSAPNSPSITCGPRTPLRRRRYSRRSRRTGQPSLCPRQARRRGQLLDLRVRRPQYRRRIAPQEIRTVGLPPSRQGRLRRDHPQALDASCSRQGYTPRQARRGRPAQHPRRLLDHHLGKSLRHHRVGTHHPGGAGIARMYAGKEATAEFGDYHSAEAVAHMAHFCIGDLVEPNHLAVTGHAALTLVIPVCPPDRARKPISRTAAGGRRAARHGSATSAQRA